MEIEQNTEKQIILLTVSGEDRPGLTTSLTGILGEYGADILDIGQADIHKNLNLAIVFEMNADDESAPLLKDILMKSYQLGLNIKFTPLSAQEYIQWANNRSKRRHVITVLSRHLSAYQIHEVTRVIAEHNLNIRTIYRVTHRPLPDDPDRKVCLELKVEGEIPDPEQMTREFLEVSSHVGVDISFQEDNMYYRNRRLVCFDMDSTLIQAEVMDELAKKAGSGEEVCAITASAMRGEIDFKESFTRRLKTLKGLPESTLAQVAKEIPLTEGAERLITTLKRYGYKTAIISGGFTYFGEYLKKRLGIDYVFANELEIKDGILTGNYVGEIVDGVKKADYLRTLAQIEGISTQQVVALGDGANDLPMLRTAGLGIAFQAKQTVKENAEHAISSLGLDGVLYLLGYRDRHIEKIN
ncbi:MAG: phosphoserine phosphatase SerB [Flavobacteriales bacterium]|nr:phosphoserine phosphatase SerB [Flavobacteriales bacterium]